MSALRKPDTNELIPARFTVEEYLERERQADVKSEYVNGQIVLMAGGSPAHSLITANLSGEFYNALRGSLCRTYSADLRVRSTPTEYVYPDLTVICGDIETDDLDPHTATNPRLLVEVLSPSSSFRDHVQKWLHYQFLPSLTDYIMVHQDQPFIEHFTRETEDAWQYRLYRGLDAELTIPALGCRIPLRAIYGGVAFSPILEGQTMASE